MSRTKISARQSEILHFTFTFLIVISFSLLSLRKSILITLIMLAIKIQLNCDRKFLITFSPEKILFQFSTENISGPHPLSNTRWISSKTNSESKAKYCRNVLPRAVAAARTREIRARNLPSLPLVNVGKRCAVSLGLIRFA